MLPGNSVSTDRLLIYQMLLPLVEQSTLTLFIHMHKYMLLPSQNDHSALIHCHRSITLCKLSHHLLCLLFSGCSYLLAGVLWSVLLVPAAYFWRR